MIVIDRNVPWIIELACLLTILSELVHERAAIIITRESLYSVVFSIHDEQETSMMVERQARWASQRTVSAATFLGAERELDASR